MIRTLFRIMWTELRRDRIALGLTFVLPIVFFTIFAAIFQGMGGSGGDGLAGEDGISVILVDEDQTDLSRRFADAVATQDGIRLLRVEPGHEGTVNVPAYTREAATDVVYAGEAQAALIVPSGFGKVFGTFAGELPEVEIIYDPADPFARYAVTGLVQAASFQTAPDVMIEQGFAQLGALEGMDAGLTTEQQRALDRLRPFLTGERPWSQFGRDPGDVDAALDEASASNTDNTGFQGLVQITSSNVREVMTTGSARDEDEPGTDFSTVPYYAAGIGVMFLLFSMAGAAGSMLKEAETGALDRVLSSNITMTMLLASKWGFFTLVGSVQLFIMFAWGSILFDLDLWTVNHLVGFAIMTLITAGAAGAFGMMLATMCRSRGQLDGISAIVILMMSAIGGSMVPRYIMPEFMQQLSGFTFNGQALNGYLSVFWYSKPDDSVGKVIGSILAPAGILAVMAAAFFAASRLFARRWDVT